VFPDDLVGGLSGNFLYIHATLGAGHNHGAGRHPIQQHGQVKLFPDVRRNRDDQLVHEPPFGAGLPGDQHIAQHRPGFFVNIFRRSTKPDAPLKTILKRTPAAPPGMNLRLNRDERGSLAQKPRRNIPGRLWRSTKLPRRLRHSRLIQQLPGLVFV